MRRGRSNRRNRGFTLIEMMIVISLILILISIALPVYNRAILRAKEGVLKQDLFTLRQVIDQYTMDKKKAPQALDDIVTAGYLKVVPKDPFTNEANWTLEQEDATQAADQQEPGIIDVHSSSNLTATDGTAYSSW
ncbi:MAG TPA: prepilin-type N-terminal cleavage/methylation domain-containing protein [Terriglobales bacterium]|nr:prepilin-type N-terminal cleavage/methylation domain-containing protein [Terriglobales bacterium]